MTIDEFKHAQVLLFFGVPLALRPAVEATFADKNCQFPSVVILKDESFYTRFSPETTYAVLYWPGVQVPDVHIAWLKEQNTVLLELSPIRLYGPDRPPVTDLLPYGVQIFDPQNPDIAISKAGEGEAQNHGGALLAAYVKSGITEINSGTMGRQSSDVWDVHTASPIAMVVADATFTGLVPVATRYTEYANLLKLARQLYPAHEIVFCTNGDNMPRDEAMLNGILDNADVTFSAYWRPEFAEKCEAVLSCRSLAAFDGWVRGCKAHVQQDPEMAHAISGQGDPEAFLEARFLSNAILFDPVNARALDAGILFAIIQARVALIGVPSLRGSQIWPKAHGPVNFAGGRSPDAAFSLVEDLIDETRLSEGALSLIAPSWLDRVPVSQPAPPDTFLAMSEDAGLVPGLLGLTGGAAVPLREINLYPGGSRAEVTAFALHQPELFTAAIAGHIRNSGCRRALVVDLADPAVRLFTRVCARMGLACTYVPPLSLVGDTTTGDIIDRTIAALSAAPMLCDQAVVWSQAQGDALERQGFSADRIIRSSLPDRGQAQTCGILVWLNEEYPEDLRQLETRFQFIKHTLLMAGALGQSVHFVFGQSFLVGTSANILDQILLESFASYSLLVGGGRPGGQPVMNADVVLGDNFNSRCYADQLGAPFLEIPRAAEEGDTKVDSAVSRMREEVGKVFDYMQDLTPASVAGTEEYPDLAQAVLATPLKGSGERKSVFERLLSGENLAIPRAMSSVPIETFSKENRYVLDLLNIRSYSPVRKETSVAHMVDADVRLQWGLRNALTAPRKKQAAIFGEQLGIERLFVEDGFIRSVEIGLTGAPGLSVSFDDMGPFYDATRPSRVETILNGEVSLTAAEQARATKAMKLITEKKVTKYNFAPYRQIKKGNKGRKTILIVDQRAGDMSISLGMGSGESFSRMVRTALSMAADHDIIIKTHPDANVGGKESAIGAELLSLAGKNAAVTLYTDDTNPYSLIDAADKVFVVTSGMGFEALMAGREVWCFGMPFYAGWGLTTDAVRQPRRTSTRTLEEVFHTFYIGMSRYFDPVAKSICEIEDIVAYMEKTRPWSLDTSETQVLFGGSDAQMDQRLSYLRNFGQQSNIEDYDTILAIGFSKWKQDFYRMLLQGTDVRYLPKEGRTMDHQEVFLKSKNPAIMLWGHNSWPGLATFARKNGIPVFRIEDGFLRSVGLGANHILPYSICLDSRSIYFDARTQSDLEVMLLNYDFDAEPELMDKARMIRERIIAEGLSKYNFPTEPVISPFGPKTRRRVLVIGQVEDDASIRFGAPAGVNNNDLVRLARAENPDAQVIYKIHPDVLAAKRPELSDPNEVAHICDIYSDNLPLAEAFDEVDQVYTITSLAGFEALMRGIPVTTIGTPFYAGWGLTDDRDTCSRRTRTLTLDELFAGAYLLYAKYVDPITGGVLDPNDVVERLVHEIKAHRLAAF